MTVHQIHWRVFSVRQPSHEYGRGYLGATWSREIFQQWQLCRRKDFKKLCWDMFQKRVQCTKHTLNLQLLNHIVIVNIHSHREIISEPRRLKRAMWTVGLVRFGCYSDRQEMELVYLRNVLTSLKILGWLLKGSWRRSD